VDVLDRAASGVGVAPAFNGFTTVGMVILLVALAGRKIVSVPDQRMLQITICVAG
jgi:hypothetical protein